jgi:3-hydroxymyristoyl/3-hydroxydecanoyl-(acyl carrier protein) dehydratase
VRRIARLKFRRTIGPGDELELRLTFDAPRGRASFEILRGAEACSAGTLEFHGEFAAEVASA